MADLSTDKPTVGAVFPVGQLESTIGKLEPLVTPQDLRDLYLFGIPLVSGVKDPFTGRPQQLTDVQINKLIDKAIGAVEAETGLVLFPTQFEEKLPFDKCEYESFGFFRMINRPISSIQSITVNLANNLDVYQVPLEWVEVGLLARGQINLIPLTLALTGSNNPVPQAAAGGAAFLAILGNRNWISSFWKFLYVAGFPNDQLPKIVNQIVAYTAAIDILSMLAPTYGRTQSASLGIDNLSQSVSGPGKEIYANRYKEIKEQKDMLVKKIKKIYGLGIISGNV